MIPFLAKVPAFVWSGLAVGAVMLALLVAQKIEIAHVKHDLARVQALADDRLERLTTCRGSVAVLEAAVEDQNEAVAAMAAESAARMAERDAALALARADAEAAQARVRSILNRPIVGATACERFLDVDAMVMEALQ